MAKKTTKKKSASKKAAHKTSSKAEDCDTCEDNDTILKVVFIVLGIGVIIAAYFVGYMVGSGGMPDLGSNSGSGGVQAADGAVVITEYSDFECPFCQRFYEGAYQQIRNTYGDNVVFEYKHFPLGFHPNAQKAAEASECARDQGEFWAYHDRLFEMQQLTVPQLKAHAGALGLDQAEFDNCLDSGEKASIVSDDMAEAQARGVRGTPSFWINGELVVGAQPFEVFQPKIDAALGGEAPAPAAPAAPSPSPAPAPTMDVSVDDDAVLGDADAPVTIIEFTDYECPFCGRHKAQTVPQIIENFVETGQVKYIIRDFPLSFHQNAQKAGEAAECAGEQGEYFAYGDILFENQQALSIANLKSYAGDLGLNQAEFDNCLDSGEMAQEVKDDFAAGQAAGVRGTPAVFINGKMISGAQPYVTFEAAINEALAQ